MLVLHGLNASSHAHYMRGIAAKAFARGMNVVRLNQRNCGDTEHLSAGLFHSGLTADARYVIGELSAVDGISSIAVAGYSLGGNLALKLAGEFGDESAPGPARGRCGVADPGDRRMRPRARTAPQRSLPVEFREGLETADAAERSLLAGPLRSRPARRRPDRARLRRGIYRAALRLPERRRLLLSRQRHASHRSHPRTRA